MPERRLKLLVLVVTALLIPALAHAQVNVESLSRTGAPEGFSGSVNGSLAIQTGNTELVQLGLGSRIEHVAGPVTTLIVGNGGIGLLGSNRFSSSGLGHLRKTYRMGGWLSPEWYTQINYDRAQLLTFRTLVGGGARTPVTGGDWGSIGAGTSLMLEYERLELPEGSAHAHRTTAVRMSTFATLRALSGDRLLVASTTYVQPRADDLGDLRILEEMTISSEVTERLALTVTFNLRYDSGPPDGLAALDTRLVTGLTFSY